MARVKGFTGILPGPLARAAGIASDGKSPSAPVHIRLPSRAGIAGPRAGVSGKSLRERQEKICTRRIYCLGRDGSRKFARGFPLPARKSPKLVVVYDGFEKILSAYRRGKSVCYLTGRSGGWELSAIFSHSLAGLSTYQIGTCVTKAR